MKTTGNSRIIVLAAGGTGGHIFPAVALAEVLRARGYTPHLVTDHRFHHYNKSSGDGVLGTIPIHTICAASLGGGVVRKLRNIFGIGLGVVQAWRILRRLQPLAVVGFGGYPSFPTLVASIARGERTILHEQNSVLGRVNRVLARRAEKIATSYPETRRMPESARPRVVLTGNPVRAAVCAIAQVEYPALTEDGLLRVLVIGGSQGASVFSDVVPEAMKRLPGDLRGRIRLDQQCRTGEIEAVRAAYAALGMQVDTAPFFVDMAVRLAAAHLVICRAGASTVSELMVAGKPAILVPLPIAADNHQYYNAQAIEDTGAGWVVTQQAFTPEALAAKIETLMRSPHRLTEAAARMRLLANVEAAQALAEVVVA
ncbi:MAG: undecaprenyldiphospho-muramoylpentapeptide beta-N-acetylglucosaminyltransferase [Alphaproteobacteria bacterium]|nr:undecaprenyldiphospho-muramoylpentapeptide beta-N-acetylglucosaminyltransferase [Alphaproteobacteria bacterium]